MISRSINGVVVSRNDIMIGQHYFDSPERPLPALRSVRNGFSSEFMSSPGARALKSGRGSGVNTNSLTSPLCCLPASLYNSVLADILWISIFEHH
jgi:hypothetical protein